MSAARPAPQGKFGLEHIHGILCSEIFVIPEITGIRDCRGYVPLNLLIYILLRSTYRISLRLVHALNRSKIQRNISPHPDGPEISIGPGKMRLSQSPAAPALRHADGAARSIFQNCIGLVYHIIELSPFARCRRRRHIVLKYLLCRIYLVHTAVAPHIRSHAQFTPVHHGHIVLHEILAHLGIYVIDGSLHMLFSLPHIARCQPVVLDYVQFPVA